MNKVKPVEEKKEAPVKKVPGKGRKFIRALNVIGLIDKQALVRFMPFVFFLTFLAVIYIGNSYMAEHTIRQIDQTEKDLKELRSEYISGKTELMFRSKQTEVAAAVVPLGLKESTTAPRKIVVRTDKVK